MNIAILLKTWWRGQLVGQDDYGNRYYLDRKPAYDGRHRRWVIYKGMVEATKTLELPSIIGTSGPSISMMAL